MTAATAAPVPIATAPLRPPNIAGTRWCSPPNNRQGNGVIPGVARRMRSASVDVVQQPNARIQQLQDDINTDHNRATHDNVRQQDENMQHGDNRTMNEDIDGFIEVQNRKQRRLNNRNTQSNELQGAPLTTKTIFVYMVNEGDLTQVNNFLNKNNVKVIKSVRASHESALYKSFKVEISSFDENKVLRHSFWPNGIQCKLWRERSSRTPDIDYGQEY